MSGLQADVPAADDVGARIAATFDYLLMLSRATDVVGDVHRRLLSLYPDVPSVMIEEALSLHAELQRMAEDEAAEEDAATSVFGLLLRLQEVVLVVGI